MSYVIVSGSGISPDCTGTYLFVHTDNYRKDAVYQIEKPDVYLLSDTNNPGTGWTCDTLIGTYVGTDAGHTGNPIVTGPFADTGGISGEEFMNEMWDF
jgi:hypothetical protein